MGKNEKKTAKNKISFWRKEGYKMHEDEKEMKKVLHKEIGKNMKNLKKQGKKKNNLNK